MKFSTSKNELQEALQKLSKATPIRSTLPILSCVLINATNEKTTLVSTDLEITINVNLSVSIEQEGCAAVPLKQLYDITNEFSEGTRITISIDNKNKIKINTLSGSYDLMGKQKEEFPTTPKISETKKIKIESKVLRGLINSTLFAVSKDDLKPSLTGVLFRFNSNGLTVVATDGHRLVKIVSDKYKKDIFKGDVVVPKKFLSYLSSHLSDGEVVLSIAETHLTATIDQDTIISRTISEVFPDYESVIPQDNNNELIVDKKSLLGAIKRVSIFSNKSTHQIAFNLSREQFFITTEDPEASSRAKEELIATYDGEDLLIGYNGEYLKDVINHTTGDEVTLKLNTPISATLFIGPDKNENKIMLLMPVRINS
tara:strand:- start:2014 stop:3123 length:1110 start_codon:yes stop_codon:yes gene_type:complete